MKKLFVLFTALSLGACSSDKLMIKPLVVERPPLILPETKPVEMQEVRFIVITKDNYQEILKDFEKRGEVFVVFAVTSKGYENLALNLAELRRYISQQQAVIIAYKSYVEQK